MTKKMSQLAVTKRGPKQSLGKSVDRFWSRVDQSAGRFRCWPWTAMKSEKGYGKTYFMGKVMRAHRIAYELEYGPVPNGLLVCHVCDNPSCCNPYHLVAATAKDNTHDMIHKGRANFYNNLPNLKGRKQ